MVITSSHIKSSGKVNGVRAFCTMMYETLMMVANEQGIGYNLRVSGTLLESNLEYDLYFTDQAQVDGVQRWMNDCCDRENARIRALRATW